MKQSKLVFKLLPVLLAFCLFIGTVSPDAVIIARGAEYPDNYESFSNEEKQAYLEQQLKEINEKLDNLAGQSKDTEEYINALDEKIRYMNNQLTLSKQEMNTSKDKITTLERQYSENEKSIAALQIEIEQISKDSAALEKKFAVSQQQYAKRARAMYVSGNMTTLEAILTSGDISTLLTRLEMIRRVSRQDKKLLETLQTQGRELESTQKELSDKKDSLTNNQQALVTTRQTLTSTVQKLEKQQVEYSDKQKVYESEKAEADNLLVKIQEDTKNFSEFRHQTQEDIEEINSQIEEDGQKYIQELEQQKTTTTAKPTETKPESSAKPQTTATTTTTKRNDSNKLSFIYPVPSQTRITTAYGSAGYAGHTGVDFACASGSNVVAVESGIVTTSTDITSHQYCSCSYTGGGYHSYGRYIVILHDKKDSAGNYVFTLYAHNSQRLVSKGQRVEKGQIIAKSGTTGNSSGPHCHFEVRTPDSSYGSCVNPTNYLP